MTNYDDVRFHKFTKTGLNSREKMNSGMYITPSPKGRKATIYIADRTDGNPTKTVRDLGHETEHGGVYRLAIENGMTPTQAFYVSAAMDTPAYKMQRKPRVDFTPSNKTDEFLAWASSGQHKAARDRRLSQEAIQDYSVDTVNGVTQEEAPNYCVNCGEYGTHMHGRHACCGRQGCHMKIYTEHWTYGEKQVGSRMEKNWPSLKGLMR